MTTRCPCCGADGARVVLLEDGRRWASCAACANGCDSCRAQLATIVRTDVEPPAKPAQPYDERRIPARKDESDQGSLF